MKNEEDVSNAETSFHNFEFENAWKILFSNPDCFKTEKGLVLGAKTLYSLRHFDECLDITKKTPLHDLNKGVENASIVCCYLMQVIRVVELYMVLSRFVL
jgi:hypothetical protein